MVKQMNRDKYQLQNCGVSSIFRCNKISFSVKTLIAWGKANDERWVQLDDIVYSKLKNCNSLTERLDLLQNYL